MTSMAQVKRPLPRRLVIKIGSSSLCEDDGALSLKKMRSIAGALALAKSLGIELALVSSGAVAAGADLLQRARPKSLPEKQAFAAAGQARLMQLWAEACAPIPVAQFLISAGDIQNRKRFINAKQAMEAAFKLGLLPIINENDTVATAELKLGDNDTLSAWTAHLIQADALLLLTDVDGLYSANPRTDPKAVRLLEVADIRQLQVNLGDAGSVRGTGGMRTKVRAATIAAEVGIETTILSGGGEGIRRWLLGDLHGTRILAMHSRNARSAWLLHQVPVGQIHIDAGAESALRAGKSLLPSGITRIDGQFAGEAIVQIVSDKGALAMALSALAAAELRQIAGRQSHEIAQILGRADLNEAIHRDQLALIA
jgi:glutamate 5-kinase